MANGLGIALKVLQWFNRGVLFCCTALILALTSYFLATMTDHHIHIPTYLRAVEGIAGIGVVYSAVGLALLCCLAGFALTSFIAIVLDVAFVGAFIYVATRYKDGTSSCTGSNVNTVFGNGNAASDVKTSKDGSVPLSSYKTACRMESACLAVSIVAIVFFIFAALTEVVLVRQRRKERRFGPSPANNYTSGYGSRRRGLFGFRRNQAAATTADDSNILPKHTAPDQVRESYNTDHTRVGETYPKYGEAGYNEHGTATKAGGYPRHNV